MNIPVNPQTQTDWEPESLLKIPVFPGAGDARGPLTDADLVSRTRAGDHGALQELLGRHAEPLFRLAWRFVRNEQDAQEILQNVLVTTWRKLPGFEDRSQIGTWLYRVTVNASLMLLRERSRRWKCVNVGCNAGTAGAANVAHEMDPTPRSRPDEQLESRELGRALAHAIDRLPAGLRPVFDLRELQGWSTRKTGRWLGLSDSAVKTRLHRARIALRAEMAGFLVQ
jgi:RNA polymerase sigma-70 factor (ECF subfamily)